MNIAIALQGGLWLDVVRLSWISAGALAASLIVAGAVVAQERIDRKPVSSGRVLSPAGSSVGVGSFPCNMVVSPDGNYAVVTDSGYREQLSVVDLNSGKIVDTADFSSHKTGIYYGVAFGREGDKTYLYASQGEQGTTLRYDFGADGKLIPDAISAALTTNDLQGANAGLSAEGSHLAIAINSASADAPYNGQLLLVDTSTSQKVVVQIPGYPLDVLTVAGTTFVSCERDGVIAVVRDGKMLKSIPTGSNPTKLTLSPDQKSIYITNSGSDTLCQIDIASLSVVRTIPLRPDSMRGLPISTPLASAFSADGKTIFVALADLNAVGVVDTASGKMRGLIPTGWYPSALTVKNSTLYVASAKGIESQHPNGVPQGPAGTWGKYDENIIEGTLSKIDLTAALADLKRSTAVVMTNDNLQVAWQKQKFDNPGIQHVIYVVKENRTYDQVFGDIKTGLGDPSLVMFGQDVTPNEHALAQRFTLLDNFYTCAEVSADGWNWSTSGMINEYTARNVPANYSGRRANYDFEGGNGSLFPDLLDIPDVARAPGGYIWDDAARNHVSLRNYGFFVGSTDAGGAKNDDRMDGVKKALVGTTDTSYKNFDLRFADSDLWQKVGVKARRQLESFGTYKSPSRYSEWKREFDGYVANKNMPALSLLRLPRDHTSGTGAGNWSPRAMVADNDYALGEIVEAVSHSPYWASTVICVLEDDSQSGFDHIDCHRSTALVISPMMERGRHDSRFYNTDSMLRTIEVVLGLPPMNGFDATAQPIGGLAKRTDNMEPYSAIMPDKAIATEINKPTAYRSADSERILNPYREESAADLELNDILWGALKQGKPPITRGHGTSIGPDADGDGDGD